MSARWTFWAWDQKIKKAPLKLALLQLADNANDEGVSWYSVPRMAERCGMAERTMQGHLKTLEDMGMLEIKERPGTSSIYQLKGIVEFRLTPAESAPLPPQILRPTPAESADDPNNDPNNESNSNRSLVPAEPKRSKFKYEPSDLECAQWMLGRVEIINPAMKKPNLESWANTIRLMREMDHRTHEQICHTFDWANKDSFWYKNILSPEKLRKQFDKLQVRINETSNGSCQSGGGNNGNGLSHTQQQIAAARARAQSGERAASVEPMGNDGGDILDLDQSQWRHAEPPMGDGDFFIDG
ncbi:helix-turn-helix domain protein [Vibrio phage vB_VpM-pA2SJ1]|uniref:Helix-turn-helix domain protein n=1 Tax=Vibrio phage vB_VpM-pA2SJ1 TaxID=3095964 RepID=A0AAX4J529_9CAUD